MISATKQKILLIIDDSEADRRIYRRYLRTEEALIQVHEAKTAQEGLHLAARLRPDCILLDFRLPDATGLNLLSELRANVDCPVIFISGQPAPFLVSHAFREGAVSYVSKDLMTEEGLVSLIRQTIGVSG